MVRLLGSVCGRDVVRDAQWQGLKPIFFLFVYGPTKVVP